MDLSIIIVNYNTKQLTLDAIKSIYSSETVYTYEVIIIDNNSNDDSEQAIRALFPDATLISNKENVGFSKANNQGIKIAKGQYILLLNSDTIVNKNTLQTMLDFMNRHQEIGASGCKVVLPNGELDKACKRGFPTPSASFYYFSGLSKLFPDNPKFNQYQLGHLSPDKDYPVDCLVGAFMLLRKKVIDEVGLLDENFFMYGEDVDWCYRIKKEGWQIYYYPYTTITHYKGASSRRKPAKIIYEFHRSMYLFHRKHYAGNYPWFINGIVYIGIFMKFFIALMVNSIRRNR